MEGGEEEEENEEEEEKKEEDKNNKKEEELNRETGDIDKETVDEIDKAINTREEEHG